MKATFHRNNLRSRRILFIFTLIVLLCASFLLYSPTRRVASRIVYKEVPFLFDIGNIVTANFEEFFGSFRAKSSLVKENADLRDFVARMQAQVLDRNLLEERVQMLEEVLGRKGMDNRVISTVLSGPGQSPYDTLIIDAGIDVGIRRGNLVVYAGAGVIGRVAEVYPSSAKITLFSSPTEEEFFVLVGGAKVPAKAWGRGMGNFETRVPQGSIVSVGSDVVLSENPSFILGIVGSVEEKESMPFIKVLFRAPFNIAEIRQVEIITTVP
ncbi:MAG: rod shape-determining protein MreC [Candidatus Yonathbacteria bacterium]|nr:rod shape-determining protein MreC [Candidatus Yonathbacteria bacterium]